MANNIFATPHTLKLTSTSYKLHKTHVNIQHVVARYRIIYSYKTCYVIQLTVYEYLPQQMNISQV